MSPAHRRISAYLTPAVVPAQPPLGLRGGAGYSTASDSRISVHSRRTAADVPAPPPPGRRGAAPAGVCRADGGRRTRLRPQVGEHLPHHHRRGARAPHRCGLPHGPATAAPSQKPPSEGHSDVRHDGHGPPVAVLPRRGGYAGAVRGVCGRGPASGPGGASASDSGGSGSWSAGNSERDSRSASSRDSPQSSRPGVAAGGFSGPRAPLFLGSAAGFGCRFLGGPGRCSAASLGVGGGPGPGSPRATSQGAAPTGPGGRGARCGAGVPGPPSRCVSKTSGRRRGPGRDALGIARLRCSPHSGAADRAPRETRGPAQARGGASPGHRTPEPRTDPPAVACPWYTGMESRWLGDRVPWCWPGGCQ